MNLACEKSGSRKIGERRNVNSVLIHAGVGSGSETLINLQEVKQNPALARTKVNYPHRFQTRAKPEALDDDVSPRPGGDWFAKRGVGRQRDADPGLNSRESCELPCGMAAEPGGAGLRLPGPALRPEAWPGVPAR